MNAHLFSMSMIAAVALGFSVVSAISQDATPRSSNHCKSRVQSDCNAAVACAWRETITDGVSKTSCIYNPKAARAIVAEQFKN